MAVKLLWFGKGWSSWPEFRSELARRGINANDWIRQYPAAAAQIGAPPPSGGGGGGGVGGNPNFWGALTAAAGSAGGGGGGSVPPNGGAGGKTVSQNPDGTGNYQFPDGSVWTLTTGGWVPAGDGGPGGEEGGGSSGVLDAPPGGDPGGGGGGPPPAFGGAMDWSEVLGVAGLPSDVMAGVNNLIRTIADPQQAVTAALAYVRGSTWYKQTFVGIDVGVQKGLFADERGYRDYRNQLDQVYQQWTGGSVGQTGLLNALNEGAAPDTINRRFTGRAWVEANRNDAQYLAGAFRFGGQGQGRLSENELGALGEQQAGLPSQLGTLVDSAMQKAADVAQRVFQGQAASPQLALTRRGTLFSPGTSAGRTEPDVAA